VLTTARKKDGSDDSTAQARLSSFRMAMDTEEAPPQWCIDQMFAAGATSYRRDYGYWIFEGPRFIGFEHVGRHNQDQVIGLPFLITNGSSSPDG